jgi:hypothetical protein
MEPVMGMVTVAMWGMWTLALGLTIWILGPAVAILLGRRRIDVDVHPEPALSRPYPEDADGLRRYDEFVELGFRPIGWTSEHARFLTPLNWNWRSIQGARWLASPDNSTFVSLYRVVEDEPVRFCATTLLDGDGSWGTMYPGAAVDLKQHGNHGRVEVRSVGPAELLARHGEHVESFRRERGLGIRSGTLDDVAAASLAYTRAHFATQSTSQLLAMPLGLFAMPAAFLYYSAVTSAGGKMRLVHLGGVVFMALFYAVMRYGLLKLTMGHAARHSHTRAFDLAQTAVAPDGTITPGRHERWLRALAVVAAIDLAVYPVRFLFHAREILARGPGAGLVAAVYGLVIGMVSYHFLLRARGRAPVRKGKNQPDLPFSWVLWGGSALILGDKLTPFMSATYWAHVAPIVALAALGWHLEKTTRK